MKEEQNPNRRSFLDILLGVGAFAWLGSVVYPIVQYLKVPPQNESIPTTVVAAKVSAVKPNENVIFRFGNDPAILIRDAVGNFKAFSAVCTHLACTVQYRSDLEKIWCACHNGIYDMNGRNISGPPPRPLTEYKVIVKGKDVLVSKA